MYVPPSLMDPSVPLSEEHGRGQSKIERENDYTNERGKRIPLLDGWRRRIPEHFNPPRMVFRNVAGPFFFVFVGHICLCYEYNSSQSLVRGRLDSLYLGISATLWRTHDDDAQRSNMTSNRIWSTIKVFQSLVCPLLSRIKVEGFDYFMLIVQNGYYTS